MPPKNGIRFDFGNVWLCNGDGEAVCKFAGIQEFDDTCYAGDHSGEVWGRINCDREYSFALYYDGVWKVMKKIMYGWTAKGPIRRRVLEKLWGTERSKHNEDRR